VEEDGEDGGKGDEVVGLDGIEVVVVAGSEGHADAVEDIAGEEECECLLDLEDEVSGGIVGKVALRESPRTCISEVLPGRS
jgi:hypothetical protein